MRIITEAEYKTLLTDQKIHYLDRLIAYKKTNIKELRKEIKILKQSLKRYKKK